MNSTGPLLADKRPFKNLEYRLGKGRLSARSRQHACYAEASLIKNLVVLRRSSNVTNPEPESSEQ